MNATQNSKPLPGRRSSKLTAHEGLQRPLTFPQSKPVQNEELCSFWPALRFHAPSPIEKPHSFTCIQGPPSLRPSIHVVCNLGVQDISAPCAHLPAPICNSSIVYRRSISAGHSSASLAIGSAAPPCTHLHHCPFPQCRVRHCIAPHEDEPHVLTNAA